MEEKKSEDVRTELLDNFLQHYAPMEVEYDNNDSNNNTSLKPQFVTGTNVIYFDYHLKLWKRGEVITYVDPEYKVSWGGSWAWVHYKELHKDNGDGKLPQLKGAKKGAIGNNDSNDASHQRVAVVKAVNWSHFTDFFSDYLLTNLWKTVDKNFDGFIEASDLDKILHELVTIFLTKSGLIAGKITPMMTKPFVDVLKQSIMDNLDVDVKDGKISFKEFKHFSLWVPRSLKQMFQNGLVINMDEFAQFLNDKLLTYIWDRFSDGRQSISVNELRPMMHELVLEYCRKYHIDSVLDASLTKPYVDKLVEIVLNKLDIDKNGSISKKEFLQFKHLIPRGINDVLGNELTEQLIVDLTQLERFMSDKMLDEIWLQFDPQQNNVIKMSELRLMFHALFEKYSQSMGLQRFIDSETIIPLVDSLCTTVMRRLDKNQDGELTREEFGKLGEMFGQLKIEALQSIDMNELSKYLEDAVLEEIWDEFDANESGEIETSQLNSVIEMIMKRFVDYTLSNVTSPTAASVSLSVASVSSDNNNGDNGNGGSTRKSGKLKKHATFRNSTQIFQFGIIQATVKTLVPIMIESMDPQQTGKIKKEDFLKFRIWLPRANEAFLRIDFEHLAQILTQNVLEKLWTEFDSNNEGYIDENRLKTILEIILKNYFVGIGATQLIKSQQMQSVLQRFSAMLINKFDMNNDGRITKQDFEQMGKYLREMKQNALNAIDWAWFELNVNKELLENTWNKCDIDNKGYIAHTQAIELYSNLLQEYYNDALTKGTNQNLKVFESVTELKRFGIIRSAASIMDTSISRAMTEASINDENENAISNDSDKSIVTKEDFVRFNEWFKMGKENIKMKVSSLTATVSQINFHDISKSLTQQVLNSIWVQFDNGNGKISVEQLQGVFRALLEKNFENLGIDNISFDDPRIVSFIRESTDVIVKEIEGNDGGHGQGDGTITRQEFYDFLDRMRGLRKLKDFIEIDLKKCEKNFHVKLKEYWPKLDTYDNGSIVMADIPIFIQTLMRECINIKSEIKNVDMKEVCRSLTDFLTSEFMKHLILFGFSGVTTATYEITEKELISRTNNEILVKCFKKLEIETSKHLDRGVYLSLITIDMSFFGEFSQTLDIDILWDKVDKDGSGFIETEELEILFYTWICEELKKQGEPIPRSRKQVKTLLKSMTNNVLNYCDIDKDGRLSKSEFNRFLNYLKNMKRIDESQADIAAKLLDNLPLNATIKSVLAHSDSVMPNDLRIRVQSIIQDLNAQLDAQFGSNDNNENENKESRAIGSAKTAEFAIKIDDISRKHLASAITEQVCANKKEEFGQLFAIHEEFTQHGKLFNENMSQTMALIQQDILDVVMSKAPAVRNRGLSLKANDIAIDDETTKTKIERSLGSFFNGDVLGIITGVTPEIASSVESTIVTKALNRIILGIAQLSGMDPITLSQLKNVLDSVVSGVEFAEKFHLKLKVKLQGKDVTFSELFELLSGEKEDSRLFKAVMESLSECLNDELQVYSVTLKEELTDSLVQNIKDRSQQRMRAQCRPWCEGILWFFIFRIIGLLLIVASIIMFVLAIVFFIISFIFATLTFCIFERLVIAWYAGIIAIIFWFTMIKTGFVMLFFPTAAILGLAEFGYELAFTNIFAARVLNWLNESTNNEFDLREFVEMIVDWSIDWALFVVQKIDVAGILEEKLEMVHSENKTLVAKALTRRDRPNAQRVQQQKKDLRRRSHKQPANQYVMMADGDVAVQTLKGSNKTRQSVDVMLEIDQKSE